MPPRVTNRKERRHRDDLVGEHKISDVGQMVLACLFMAIWIADSFFFKRTTGLDQYMPLGVKIPLGLVLLILSGYLAKTGLSIVFGEKRQKPDVIKKSVFSVVRHPIYLSEILLYLGLLMLNMSLAAVVIWVIAIGFLHYISRHEEKLLLARFGEEYGQYMREVPMWIPRLRRK
ncbi:MAG: isoprenylcysteine carboxylmethyltransferase family protein [Dehalococcoidia bacterium]|nr:isoprenylcysteine carboxylmethyltransferase family protein [Dehalococcoidia bacterium]